MKKNKFISILFTLLLLSSCSQLPIDPNQNELERYPAGTPAEDCKTLVNKIISQNPDSKNIIKPWESSLPNQNAITALKNAKLLTFQDKFFVLHLPAVDWFNSVRKSVIAHMKTWNKTRYPIYFLSKDNDYETLGKQISDLLEKQNNGTISDDETKLLARIFSEIDSFSSYQKDIEAIINERASIQWNLEALKSLKLDKNDPFTIKLTIKKSSGDISEVVTIRREDNNLPLVIDKYRKLLIDFNGRVFKPGVLEDRILKQAMLKNIITIYHREVEYAFKNSIQPSDELTKLYNVLTSQLKNSDFDPSAYGMFRIENRVLRSEIMKLTNADQEIEKSQIFKEKFKGKLVSFFNDKEVLKIPENASLLQHAYLSVTNLSAGDLTKYGIYGVAVISAYNYFAVNPSTTALPGSTGEVISSSASSAPNSSGTGSSVVEIEDPALANTAKIQSGFVSKQYQVIQKFINKEFNSK